MRGRSGYFWPGLLILIGVFALLVNAGMLPTDRLYRLVDLWPVILVVIGLELIVRRSMKGMAAELAGALIVLVAAAATVAYVAVGTPIAGGTHTLDADDTVGALDHVSLGVDVGGATLTVKADSSLGDDLYRAHIEYSGPKPTLDLDRSGSELHISQPSFGFFQSRRFVLDLQVNPKVTWRIEVNSGAADGTFNLTGATVGSIDLNTGASRFDLTLGQPSGTVPVSMNGGALTVKVHRPAGVAASAHVSGGAVTLNADGRQFRGIGSEEWQSDGYDQAGGRYQIEVNGGACTVTVDTVTPHA